MGCRYEIAWRNTENDIEDVGVPDGTTFIVRNLFFNTPARKKFLKSAMTEAGYISDIVERIALSHPEIAIRFINNGRHILNTSGNGNLKDVIYQIFGREITSNLLGSSIFLLLYTDRRIYRKASDFPWKSAILKIILSMDVLSKA